MRWRIYYEDGSRFDSNDGLPHESPEWGCVLIAQPVEGERDLLTNDPYYYHRADLDLWFAADLIGLLDQLAHHCHMIDCVRVGRMIETTRWKELVKSVAVEMRGR